MPIPEVPKIAKWAAISGGIIGVVSVVSFALLPARHISTTYAGQQTISAVAATNDPTAPSTTPLVIPPSSPYVSPDKVKAIYLTSNTALSAVRLASLNKLLKDTELNAVVINVNDGASLPVNNPKMSALVHDLNTAGVHTIARIIVFQNEALVSAHPEFALKTSAGRVWNDTGGHHWIDPANRGAWQELLKISEAAVTDGFRELNYDYIRFPSDGNVASAVYPSYNGKTPKAEVIESFAKFLHDSLKAKHPDLILSVDIFGYSIIVNDDTHIGQKFINLVDYFDVVSPMVYPSHYRSGNFGFKNPADHPYDVVMGTLKLAKTKLTEAKKHIIVRPWLQDFNLGAVYTAAMVKAQMKAVADAGFNNGWMLWNARNVYTSAALASQ